jgi:hypothetical protein
MTVSGTGGTTPGSSEITITGISTPSAFEHDTSVRLEIYGAAPGAFDPMAPIDGATNVDLRPAFSWTAAAEAASYRLQVATDAAFSTVVLDIEGLTETSIVPDTDLASNTQHFWRVLAVNTCGSSGWTPTFTFSTEALPGDCATGTSPVGHYFEDFESGAIGWTHSAASGSDTWVLNGGISGTHSGSFVYHVDDVGSISDQRLMSPAITLPSSGSNLTLQFWNYQHLEDNGAQCWDAGILEISDDDGASWTQLLDAVLLTDPYDGTISSGSSNPLATLPGWCGSPQPWLKSVVDLDAYAGETVRFRFRIGTDVAVSEPGWDIDDVSIQTCEVDGVPIFLDGFESGSTAAWSRVVPEP